MAPDERARALSGNAPERDSRQMPASALERDSPVEPGEEGAVQAERQALEAEYQAYVRKKEAELPH